MNAVLLLVVVACGTAACQSVRTDSQPPPPAVTPQPRVTSSAQESPDREINERFVKQISESIVGRENEPAEHVFKNIQWLKEVPAGRFLRIMNEGYSRALGVNCTHCHVEQDFASDDRRPKRAAREMAVMHRMINQQLKTMQNLETKSENRAISCSTCHRGMIDPMATGQ